MTDDEKRSLLALMIGDIAGNPYHPVFTPEQYGQFLTMAKGNVRNAMIPAAISASMIIGGDYTREVIGDLSLSRNAGANYLKSLDFLIKNTGKALPDGLMPWMAGKGMRNKLLDFRRCDCDEDIMRRLLIDQLDDPEERLNQLSYNLTLTDANVETNKENIEAIDVRVTDNTARINTKADSTAVSALTTRVAEAEVDIDRIDNQVSTNTINISTKADSSALSALTTRVVSVEGGLVAIGNKVDDVSHRSEVDDVYAGGQYDS